jgi:hypothetical protein
MATTIQYLSSSATPYSMLLKVMGNVRPEGPGVITQQDLVGYAHAGPLKDAMRNANPLDFDHFNLDQVRGDEIRIYSALPDTLALPGTSLEIKWIAGANNTVAGLSCELQENAIRVIELRFNHSTQA